jgi:signal transduction histidine kinase
MTGDKSEHELDCADHRGEQLAPEPTPRFAIGTQRTERQHFSATPNEGIVHDLRSPLATITLEASLLEDQVEILGSVTIQRAIHRIRRNVDYLARIVDDLLDLSAIDRGRLTIRNARTELRELLQQTIERAVPTRDHDRVRLEAPGPLVVSADDLRIERVVANFLQNAIKYAPGRSAIVIRLERVDDRARVSVIDAGPGVAPEECDSIFDEYCRGATAGAQDGCGLGLYVSKRIVEAHGGRIGVESVPGRGSCFYFELPMT